MFMLRLIALWVFVTNAVAAKRNDQYLKATAIVTNSEKHSALECWQFTDPVDISTDAGTSGSATYTFPNTNETVYTVIPGRFNGGTHNAPAPQ